MINMGNIEMIISNLQGDALEQVNRQVATLSTTPSYLFLVSGIERISALCIQISLSVMVFYSVFGKNKLWLYPFAIVLHAIVDIPAAAMQVNLLEDMFLVELLVFIGAVSLILIAHYTHKKLKDTLST